MYAFLLPLRRRGLLDCFLRRRDLWVLLPGLVHLNAAFGSVSKFASASDSRSNFVSSAGPAFRSTRPCTSLDPEIRGRTDCWPLEEFVPAFCSAATCMALPLRTLFFVPLIFSQDEVCGSAAFLSEPARTRCIVEACNLQRDLILRILQVLAANWRTPLRDADFLGGYATTASVRPGRSGAARNEGLLPCGSVVFTLGMGAACGSPKGSRRNREFSAVR